jgi:hypothetical protein
MLTASILSVIVSFLEVVRTESAKLNVLGKCNLMNPQVLDGLEAKANQPHCMITGFTHQVAVICYVRHSSFI